MAKEKINTKSEIVVIDNELYYRDEYVEVFDDEEKIPEFSAEFTKVPEKDIKELGLNKMTLN